MIKKTLYIALGIISVACITVIAYLVMSTEQSDISNIRLDPCSYSFSTSLSLNKTCNFTASILINNCINKKYEIKSSYSNCSGNIYTNEEMIVCNWQIPEGNHTFSLYIDNMLRESKVISCQLPDLSSLTCGI